MNDVKAAPVDRTLASKVSTAARFRFAQFAGAYLGHRAQTGDSAEVVRRMYYPRPS